MLQASQALRSLVFGSIRELQTQAKRSFSAHSGHGHDCRVVRYCLGQIPVYPRVAGDPGIDPLARRSYVGFRADNPQD